LTTTRHPPHRGADALPGDHADQRLAARFARRFDGQRSRLEQVCARETAALLLHRFASRAAAARSPPTALAPHAAVARSPTTMSDGARERLVRRTTRAPEPVGACGIQRYRRYPSSGRRAARHSPRRWPRCCAATWTAARRRRDRADRAGSARRRGDRDPRAAAWIGASFLTDSELRRPAA
jgi:hypothetical protein